MPDMKFFIAGGDPDGTIVFISPNDGDPFFPSKWLYNDDMMAPENCYVWDTYAEAHEDLVEFLKQVPTENRQAECIQIIALAYREKVDPNLFTDAATSRVSGSTAPTPTEKIMSECIASLLERIDDMRPLMHNGGTTPAWYVEAAHISCYWKNL